MSQVESVVPGIHCDMKEGKDSNDVEEDRSPSADSGLEIENNATGLLLADETRKSVAARRGSESSDSVVNGTDSNKADDNDDDVAVVIITDDNSDNDAAVVVGETSSPNEVEIAMKRDPDEPLPSDRVWTSDGSCPVKLRVEPSGPLSEKPITVMTALRQTAERFPNHPAVAAKIDGKWKKWSYREYHNLVRQAAKGFIELGLEQYHSVGIVGFNSVEWFVSDLAAIYAGGFTSGIYSTNTPEACQYVANNAKCNIIVVENDHQLQKILKVRDELPDLKAIVQYRGRPKEQHPGVYSWEELLVKGDQCTDDVLEERMNQQAPNMCCTLIYTSGTTGNPKGVMLSHDNLIWTAKMAGQEAKLEYTREELISYLPLSHVAAQILDIFLPIVYAATVYFAQPDALKGSLGTTLKEVRPTSFLGVPRVWEKMQETMMSIGKSQSYLKRRVARWAKGIGLQGNLALNGGSRTPIGWSLANALVFNKVRHALGFDRCKMCMTAAAPIMKDTLDFFMSLNIPLLEIYGMSECAGPHTISVPWRYRSTSVGCEIMGCSTKLFNPDKDGNGEVCMNGRNVFMGYLNEKAKTEEVLDEEGWLQSGDIGKRDKDGFLFITGRIKELIITAGGENVAPVPIEDAIKEQLPCISNSMLVGDKRKFLAILLTLKTEVDPVTSEPTDKLSAVALDWFKSIGSEVTSVTEIQKKPCKMLTKAIQDGIDRANTNAVSRAQIVQKWTILPHDFSIAGGELGPTLKLKRPVVATMYANNINSFYAGASGD